MASQRTVLVTGATGLLGREVTTAFRLNGWIVKGTGYSRADGVDTLKADLANAGDVAKVLDEIRYGHRLVELVQSESGDSSQFHLSLLYTNWACKLLTQGLLEATRPEVVVHCKHPSCQVTRSDPCRMLDMQGCKQIADSRPFTYPNPRRGAAFPRQG